MIGKNQVVTPNSDQPMENIRPQNIYEALLISRIDPDRGMWRFYSLALQPTLLGGVTGAAPALPVGPADGDPPLGAAALPGTLKDAVPAGLGDALPSVPQSVLPGQVLGGLLVLTKGSALAPFVYTLF